MTVMYGAAYGKTRSFTSPVNLPLDVTVTCDIPRKAELSRRLRGASFNRGAL